MAITHKRGDTFTLAATVSAPITGWTIDSQVRHNGKLVATLLATITDADAGDYTLVSAAPTTDWPVGELLFDVRYTTDLGQIVSTEPVSIVCKEGPTQ